MTYAEIEAGARKLIQDEGTPYRFASADIYGYVNEGVRSLFRLRPTAFFVNGRLPTAAADMEPETVAAVSAVSGAIDVPAPAGDRHLDAFVYFVASKCLERDDSDTLNITLSDNYRSKFAELARA